MVHPISLFFFSYFDGFLAFLFLPIFGRRGKMYVDVSVCVCVLYVCGVCTNYALRLV
jgi:hypothetical protein